MFSSKTEHWWKKSEDIFIYACKSAKINMKAGCAFLQMCNIQHIHLEREIHGNWKHVLKTIQNIDPFQMRVQYTMQCNENIWNTTLSTFISHLLDNQLIWKSYTLIHRERKANERIPVEVKNLIPWWLFPAHVKQTFCKLPIFLPDRVRIFDLLGVVYRTFHNVRIININGKMWDTKLWVDDTIFP